MEKQQKERLHVQGIQDIVKGSKNSKKEEGNTLRKGKIKEYIQKN
jgi:hypothetical protein